MGKLQNSKFELEINISYEILALLEALYIGNCYKKVRYGISSVK